VRSCSRLPSGADDASIRRARHSLPRVRPPSALASGRMRLERPSRRAALSRLRAMGAPSLVEWSRQGAGVDSSTCHGDLWRFRRGPRKGRRGAVKWPWCSSKAPPLIGQVLLGTYWAWRRLPAVRSGLLGLAGSASHGPARTTVGGARDATQQADAADEAQGGTRTAG